MSAAAEDVDEVERLARVKLSFGIEPGIPRVTALVSALDAGSLMNEVEVCSPSAVRRRRVAFASASTMTTAAVSFSPVQGAATGVLDSGQ